MNSFSHTTYSLSLHSIRFSLFCCKWQNIRSSLVVEQWRSREVETPPWPQTNCLLVISHSGYWCGACRRLMCACSAQHQEELSKTDQEVMKCKHHKKHYEDKRGAHLQNIKTLEANLKSKGKELEVCHTEMWRVLTLCGTKSQGKTLLQGYPYHIIIENLIPITLVIL